MRPSCFFNWTACTEDILIHICLWSKDMKKNSCRTLCSCSWCQTQCELESQTCCQYGCFYSLRENNMAVICNTCFAVFREERKMSYAGYIWFGQSFKILHHPSLFSSCYFSDVCINYSVYKLKKRNIYSLYRPWEESNYGHGWKKTSSCIPNK